MGVRESVKEAKCIRDKKQLFARKGLYSTNINFRKTNKTDYKTTH